MATLLARYGLLSRQGSPSGSSPAVSTGWGATSPCADTRAGASALDSATANPQTSLPFFAICDAPFVSTTALGVHRESGPHRSGGSAERRRISDVGKR